MTKPTTKPRRRTPRRGARVPESLLAKLGEPPAKPDELRTWTARLAAEVTWLEMRGEIGRTLAARLRADVGALIRACPRSVAERYDDDQDFDEDVGPELEDIASDGAIRCER